MRRLFALTLAVLMIGTLFVPTAAADLEYGEERAELEVYQPHWVDEDTTEVERTENRTIYHVSGDRFQVQLQNVDHEHIDRVGVADGAANVEYDESRDVYIVEPEGEGTVALYWDATEPVVDQEGNVTDQTETTRYAASLQLSDTQWTHLSDEEYEQTRQDAANWSEVESEADRIGVATDWMLSVGISFAEFASNPTGQFVEGVQATIMIMTLEPGGLAVLGTFLVLIAVTAAAGFRWKHRYKKDVGDHDRAKQELDQAYLNKTRQILQQCDWPDLFPDHIAQKMHEMWGPNVWQGFKNYQLLRSPTHTKGLWLQMMAQLNYKGLVRRDLEGNVIGARALTQDELEDELSGDYDVGGNDGADGGIVDLEPDEFDFGDGEPSADGGTEQLEVVDFETLRFDDPDHRDIIEAVPADDLDDSVFLPSVEIDPDRLSLPIDNHNIDDAELIRVLNPKIPGDFESYEEFARVHGQMLEFVVNHPQFTDSEGNVRDEMDLLSFLSEMDSVLGDKGEFATADVQRRIDYWIADQMDPNAQVNETLEDAYTHGVGRDDEESADVISPEDIDLGRSSPGGGPV